MRKFINKYFDTFETIFLLIFAASLFLFTQEFKHTKIIFGIAAVLVALLYWFKASEKTIKEDINKNYSSKIYWFSLMVTPLAIFSKIRMDQNSNIFMAIAGGLLIISLAIRIYQKFFGKKKVKTSDFVRLIIALLIAFSIFALPLPNIN